MSSTFKLSTVLATDPRQAIWAAMTSPATTARGSRIHSQRRSVILEFPPLTSAQFQQWADICDGVSAANIGIYLPRRIDAAYATGPELWSGSYPNIGDTYATFYGAHLLSARHSQGVYIYDVRILVYMFIGYDVQGGGS